MQIGFDCILFYDLYKIQGRFKSYETILTSDIKNVGLEDQGNKLVSKVINLELSKARINSVLFVRHPFTRCDVLH